MANKFLNGIDTTSLSVNSQYSLPTSDGSNKQVLTTDGNGNVTFSDVDLVGAQAHYVYYEVKNSTGATIPKGTAVRAVGTDGNSGHILVSAMVADGSVEPKYFIGITSDAIGNGQTGEVIHFGMLTGFDTSGFTDGDVLFCDPANDGNFTITEPAGPNLKLAVAFVVSAAINGKIFIRVQGNEGLHELHDVNISSQADGDLLQWNATSGVWENKTLASIADSRYVNVSGDTMTGLLTFRGNTSANNFLQRLGAGGGSGNYSTLDIVKIADTDGDFMFMAYHAGIGSTTSSPKIIFGHYAPTPTDGHVLTIDTKDERVGIRNSSPSQALDVTGNVLASSFIKSGGTSSQFLKADGSVDSNSYALSSIDLQDVVNNGSVVTSGIAVNGVLYGSYGSSDTDITGLISGSTFGGLIQGVSTGHMVISLRENGGSDSFAIISGGGNYTTDTTYDKVVAKFRSDGIISLGGNTTVSGNVTASSFIKSGGTSSQFLKADGSVDSSSYALSSHNHDDRYYTESESDARFTKYVNLTSQVQLSNYSKSVIALCNADNSDADRNSYSIGTLTFHRTNGLNAPVKLDIAIEKRYNANGTNVVALAIGGDSFADNIQYVTFEKDNVVYGGIEFYFTAAQHHEVTFYGRSNFDIFGLDYYDDNATTQILDQEVYDSISTTNVSLETDFFFNNNKVWHAGNDGAGSGLDADTLDGQHASAFLTSFDITTQTDPKYLRSDIDDTAAGRLTSTHTATGTDGSINLTGGAYWYMYGFGARGASSGSYGIGLTSDIANRTLSIHVPNHAAYGSTGSVPKIGFYSNGAVEIFSVQSDSGNTYVKGLLTTSGISSIGDITFDGTATTTNQNRGIYWTAFDKEGVTDFSDTAHIRHTTNTGGHTGSVLEIKSHNDSNDGISFVTNGSSPLKHNGHTIWTSGNDGSGSSLDADLLDGNHASAFATTGHTHDDRYFRRYSGSVSGVDNTGYTTAFTVNGGNLASSIRFSVQGTTGSVVVSNLIDLVVNHSQDIMIKSQSGVYTVLTVKVVSNNNEDFAVELKTNSANAVTLYIEALAYGDETITFTNSHSFTGASLEHTCNYGFAHSGTGGNSGDIRTQGEIITPEDIRGKSFIKSGGTSSQFLKADGSVDSNTYLIKDSDQSTSGNFSAQNITANGYLQSFGLLYTRSHLQVLNAAGNGWNQWATRTSGGNYDLNVNSIYSGGNLTTAGDLTVTGGLYVEGATQSYTLNRYYFGASGDQDKFYPFVLFGRANPFGTVNFTIEQTSQGGSDPYNFNCLKGFARGQGWSDGQQQWDFTLSAYQSSEIQVLGVYRGTASSNVIIVYLRGGENYNIITDGIAVRYATGYNIGTSSTILTVAMVKDANGDDVAGQTDASQRLSLIADTYNGGVGRYYSGESTKFKGSGSFTGNVSVDGNLVVDGDGSYTLQLNRQTGQPTIKGIANTASHLILDSASGGDAVFLQNYNSGNVYLATGGGKVGIQATNPSVPLQVGSSTIGTNGGSPSILASDGVSVPANKRIALDTGYYTHGYLRYSGWSTEAQMGMYGYYGITLATRQGSTLVVRGDNPRVGINNTNPLENFHVSGTTISGAVSTTGTVNKTGITNYTCYEARSTQTGNNPAIAFHKEGVYSFHLEGSSTPRGLRILSPSSETAAGLYVQGDVVAYYSDMRLKTKLGDIENPVDKVKALNGFYYEPNEKAQEYGYEKERRIGLSAQDVKEVIPEAIHDAPMGDGYMAVDYAKIVPVLVEAIKEQQKQIDELKAMINGSA